MDENYIPETRGYGFAGTMYPDEPDTDIWNQIQDMGNMDMNELYAQPAATYPPATPAPDYIPFGPAPETAAPQQTPQPAQPAPGAVAAQPSKGQQPPSDEQPRPANGKPKLEKVYIDIHQSFVKENQPYVNAQGEQRTTNWVRMPPGSSIGGVDVGGYSFSARFVNKSKYMGKEYRTIPLLKNTEIELSCMVRNEQGEAILGANGKPERLRITARPEEIRSAVYNARKAYREQNTIEMVIHHAFVKERSFTERATGEEKPMWWVQMPPGSKIGEKDVGGYEFAAFNVRETLHAGPNKRSVFVPMNKEIELRRDVLDPDKKPLHDDTGRRVRDVVRATPAEVGASIDRQRAEYKERMSRVQPAKIPMVDAPMQPGRQHGKSL